MNWRSLLRWLPAAAMMAAIFIASSTPAQSIPNFGPVDAVVKKAGHVTGYGLLAFFYWYGLRFRQKLGWLAWLLAIVYAVTDEFHQRFTAGRHPSWVDVTLFDGGGAALALLLTSLIRKRSSEKA